ncbi:MAG: pyridoxal 5'-phosphate synthase, partial [Pseudomonadota bacterium]
MSKNTLIPTTPDAASYAAEAPRPPIPDVDVPFDLIEVWLKEARESELNDPNAMALATVDPSGMPDVRMVLLKDVSPAGFTFYTHSTSAKGQHLAATAKAALCFHWKSQRRQLRVRGGIHAVPSETADAYFKTRARQSQLGAVASDQSAPL